MSVALDARREAYLEAVEKVLALLSDEAVRIHGDALRNWKFAQEPFFHQPDGNSTMEHHRSGGRSRWLRQPWNRRVFRRLFQHIERCRRPRRIEVSTQTDHKQGSNDTRQVPDRMVGLVMRDRVLRRSVLIGNGRKARSEQQDHATDTE